jgi:hypothetical protein
MQNARLPRERKNGFTAFCGWGAKESDEVMSEQDAPPKKLRKAYIIKTFIFCEF